MTGTVSIKMDFTRPGKKIRFPWLSWIIRKFQGTPYSHVLLRWHSPTLGVEVRYEAAGNRLRFMGPIASRDRYEVVKTYAFRITKEEYKRLVTFCQIYAGIDYGKSQLVGIGLAHWFRLKKNPLSQGRKSQVCSEVAGWFLRDICGYDLKGMDLDLAGPKEIDEYLQTTGVSIVK